MIVVKKRKKTIGKMTKCREMWHIKPVTRVVKNKKGKGSYNRQAAKRVLDDYFMCKIHIAFSQ